MLEDQKSNLHVPFAYVIAFVLESPNVAIPFVYRASFDMSSPMRRVIPMIM
jgi:hypothetical protein